jgi:hypothetical protein
MKAAKERLDAAILEHHRMREQLEALEQSPLAPLRAALRRQMRRMRHHGR